MSSNLTPQEQEALIVLVEECGEVIQAASKMLRHGAQATDYTASLPRHYDNAGHLEREITHVFAAVAICDELGLVGRFNLDEQVRDKLRSMQPYLHHVDARQLALNFTMDGSGAP